MPEELSSPPSDTQWSRPDQENAAAFLGAKLPPDPFFLNISSIPQAVIVSVNSDSMRVNI